MAMLYISLVFFYLCQALFSDFLQFNDSFVNGQNNSKYQDYVQHNFLVVIICSEMPS